MFRYIKNIKKNRKNLSLSGYTKFPACLMCRGDGIHSWISESLGCQVTQQYLRESLNAMACLCNGADPGLFTSKTWLHVNKSIYYIMKKKKKKKVSLANFICCQQCVQVFWLTNLLLSLCTALNLNHQKLADTERKNGFIFSS